MEIVIVVIIIQVGQEYGFPQENMEKQHIGNCVKYVVNERKRQKKT